MKDIVAYGELKNGGFYPRNSRYYMQAIKEAGNVSDCVLTISGANKRTVEQNSYAHAVCNQMALRMNQDGWGVTGYNLYKRIEANNCKVHKKNPKTGKLEEFINPLKEMDRDEFFDIIEDARVKFMQNWPDCNIDTPAQHYGLTEEAYGLWRSGAINYFEAKKQSDKKK